MCESAWENPSDAAVSDFGKQPAGFWPKFYFLDNNIL